MEGLMHGFAIADIRQWALMRLQRVRQVSVCAQRRHSNGVDCAPGDQVSESWEWWAPSVWCRHRRPRSPTSMVWANSKHERSHALHIFSRAKRTTLNGKLLKSAIVSGLMREVWVPCSIIHIHYMAPLPYPILYTLNGPDVRCAAALEATVVRCQMLFAFARKTMMTSKYVRGCGCYVYVCVCTWMELLSSIRYGFHVRSLRTKIEQKNRVDSEA